MSTLGGAIGLTQNTGKRQAAREDLQILGMALQEKRFQEQEEQQAEAIYQDTLARVQEQASLLLDGDRAAVNKKARELQKLMQDKIKAVGGSKAAFMQNGGMGEIAQYQRDLIGSEAFAMYKNNRMNMEKILMIKEKGLGHLINDVDNIKLKQYAEEGKGPISYTGLLAEIDVDKMAYEFGHEITPEEVLKEGSNRMKLIGNYEQDLGIKFNGDDKLLLDYIEYKGYGGMGRNETMLKEANDLLMAKLKEKEANNSTSISSYITKVLGGKATVLAEDIEEKGFDLDPNAKTVLGATKNDIIGYMPHIPTITNLPFLHGLQKSSGKVFGYGGAYALKGAAKILQGKEADLAQELLGKTAIPDETGAYALDPTHMDETYDAMGSYMPNRTGVRDWNNNYKPTNIVMAFKAKAENGAKILLVDRVKNGKVDPESSKELYGDKMPNGTGAMFIRWHDPKNPSFDFYQEIPASSVAASRMLGNDLKEDNDLTSTMKEDRYLASQDAYHTKTAEDEIKYKKAAEEEAKTVAEDAVKELRSAPEFNTIYYTQTLKNYQKDGHERNNLIKSYYQAYGAMDRRVMPEVIKKDVFTQQIGNYDLSEDVSNREMPDKEIMKRYHNAQTKDPDSSEHDYYFYKLWEEIYNKNIQ